jgi:hypothetical protein
MAGLGSILCTTITSRLGIFPQRSTTNRRCFTSNHLFQLQLTRVLESIHIRNDTEIAIVH